MAGVARFRPSGLAPLLLRADKSITFVAIDASAPQALLVHRLRFDVRARLLPPGAIEFLDALAEGKTIARAFAQTTQACPQAEPAALFSLLLQEGLVTELLELSPENP